MLIGFITRRFFAMIPTLLAVSLLVFVVVKSIPGDPAQLLLGDRASPEALKMLRQEMGLDRPLAVQYFIFLKQLLIKGDFGRSLVSAEPISQIILEKFPATLELALAAIFVAVLIGVPLGILAAVRRSGWLDFAAVGTAVFGVSMPVFWLGLILIWLFGLELGWLPLSGRIGVEYSYEPMTGLMLLDALLIRDY
ncbi:MAG: ABC transporter permease, partial [Oligoflexales bacterium]|nr:ABC transporter permease [Oligoflexales bacterium]